MTKCPYCNAELLTSYGTACPECGKSQTVTALFLNLRHREEKRFFNWKRVSWIVRAAAAIVPIALLAVAVWVLLR